MRFRYVPLIAAIAWAGWLAAAPGGQEPAKKDQASAPASAPAKKEYVGSDTCAGCHDEIHTSFRKNAHIILETNKRRGWAGKACESCHGPGSVHSETAAAEDILSPKNMTPAAIDQMCLSCHKNQQTQVGRIQSGHARNSVACTSCHNVHKTGEEASARRFRTAAGVNQNCRQCHMDVWASFQKPHRHPLPEGAMSCTGCHNPHASFLNRNMRLASGQQPGCFQCHSNKRGPFVFEHAPVRNEPCTICHEPHGSANPRMMIRHEVANLCLECHSNIQSPPRATTAGGVAIATHDLRLPRWRNCTACHQKVHGSNVNGALLR